MIRNFIYCALVTIVFTLASCSKHSNHEPQRPGQPPKEDPALTDASMRIESSLLNLKYEDGGVLFSQGSDGTISAIRLHDGLSFEYNPAAPSFKINGVDYTVVNAELIGDRDHTKWHRVTLANIKTPVYIVVSL